MLRIYNTLARDKQDFVPLRPGEVRMYVCGITVYDYCHLGHARMMVAFDVVQRWLRASGYRLTYVRNITDIEDKIIKRAAENGERVEVDAAKQDPLDFVLWKHSKPGEPTWSSPWGDGRPGWHIECSAMGCTLLGEHFDIHGGGQDLQFPHHENEIAQSEGANGGRFVNYWMHNGFVRVDDTKMSKSLGNFFTIRDVLKLFDAEVVRYFMVRAHYRSPLNHSDAHLEDAKAALTRLYTALKNFSSHDANPDWSEPHAQRFKAAMDDDFNTPEAVAELHKLANLAFGGDAKSAAQLKALGGVLGLLQREPLAFLQGTPAGGPAEAEIRQKIDARLAARKAKNYAEADRIRKELEGSGVILEDGPQGTTWRRA